MAILESLKDNQFNREEIISAMEATMDEILNEVAMDSAIESTDFYADPCVSIGKSYLGAMEAISEADVDKTNDKLEDINKDLEEAKKEKDPKKKLKIIKMALAAVWVIAVTVGAVTAIKSLKKTEEKTKRQSSTFRDNLYKKYSLDDTQDLNDIAEAIQAEVANIQKSNENKFDTSGAKDMKKA